MQLFFAFLQMHIPEVGGAALEARLGVRSPNPVVVDMVRRIVSRDDRARGRAHGMQVTGSEYVRLNVGARLLVLVGAEVQGFFAVDGNHQAIFAGSDLHRGRLGTSKFRDFERGRRVGRNEADDEGAG